jgi:thiosulfate/3-mercaptopyruvate sulfurtransferase
VPRDAGSNREADDMSPPFLISPADLSRLLGQPNVSVVDASWYLPAQGRQARSEFDAAHVPGAVFFDQDAVVDPTSSLPHTLPTPELFARAVGALGIAEDDTIIVYDGLGLFSAPRVWWLLRTFGASNVRVLDGGFPAWTAARLAVEAGPAHPMVRTFNAHFDADAVATLSDMRRHVVHQDVQILDARAADRFAATAPEPRAGVRSGHMPGATSLAFTRLMEDGKLRGPAALRQVFVEAGVDLDQPIVTSCGSGVTAAVINLALASVGKEDARLYDGSWTEWGSLPDTPVETGGGAA